MTFSKSLNNFGVATEGNQFVGDNIEEVQKLKTEIFQLKKDTKNINTQIKEAKNNENNKEQNRLLQEKISINNQIKIKEEKLNKLSILDDSFNPNIQFKNDFVDKRVSEPNPIFNLVSVSSFVNKSVSSLGVGALLATVVTVGANPAQAANFTNSTTINFDEVPVGLTKDDNPNRYDEKSIDELWSSYGLEMSSMKKNNKGKIIEHPNKKLWLYDTSVAGGEDDDLLTGKEGEYVHNGDTIKYDTEAQDKVLIIQESKWRGPDDNVGGIMKFDFTDGAGVEFKSIGLLDFDEDKLPEFMVKFAGEDELITFNFDEKDGSVVKEAGEGNTEILKLASSQYITQMTRQRGTKNDKVTDENSLREYKFDFTDEDGNLREVSEFYVNLSGSGAITGLNYNRKVPEPTSILGLAAISGLAASSLKRKRKSSDI
ncbi:MAG: PEP-CTERM sorting domain-containing protein [Cyanobacteria bacterium J06649_11]